LQAFLVSLTSIGLAEMGDRTQLLALILATRFRQPLPILAGMLCAALANHAVAGLLGVWVGHQLSPRILNGVVGASMVIMGLWMLRPDGAPSEESKPSRHGAFLTTLIAFFLAEIGDKTQIATMALAAGYSNLYAVVAGSTSGLVLANAPVVFLGKIFADRLPLRALHYGSCVLMLLIGVLFLVRLWHPSAG
jgi:putative Ca2+/H+ antiporter (TMEM165/GDT1 family)